MENDETNTMPGDESAAMELFFKLRREAELSGIEQDGVLSDGAIRQILQGMEADPDHDGSSLGVTSTS